MPFSKSDGRDIDTSSFKDHSQSRAPCCAGYVPRSKVSAEKSAISIREDAQVALAQALALAKEEIALNDIVLPSLVEEKRKEKNRREEPLITSFRPVNKKPMRVLAYCLVPNHWHIVMWPETDDALTAFVRWLTLTHTMRWHAHYHTSGSGHPPSTSSW
jgi:hypothetical protein